MIMYFKRLKASPSTIGVRVYTEEHRDCVMRILSSALQQMSIEHSVISPSPMARSDVALPTVSLCTCRRVELVDRSLTSSAFVCSLGITRRILMHVELGQENTGRIAGDFCISALYTSVVAEQNQSGNRPRISNNYSVSNLASLLGVEVDAVPPDVLECESQYFGEGKRSVHFLSLLSMRKILEFARKFGFTAADDDKSQYVFSLSLDEICPM